MTETNTPPLVEKTDKQKESGNELVISFLTLRNLIGISGMLLPIVLTLLTPKGEQDKVMEHSISEYYYTKNGDLFFDKTATFRGGVAPGGPLATWWKGWTKFNYN